MFVLCRFKMFEMMMMMFVLDVASSDEVSLDVASSDEVSFDDDVRVGCRFKR